MIKYWILAIIIILLLLFLLFYEVIFLEFYEEIKAECYSDYIWIPLFSALYLYVFFMGFITSIRRRENDWKNFIKEAAGLALVLTMAYYIFIKPVFSSLLMFLNVSIGHQDVVYMQGTVVSKTGIPGQKGSELTIVVEDAQAGLIPLNTTANNLEFYNIGDSFQKELRRGIFGMIYLKK